MLYSKYLFSCVFNDDAVLPEYKGSTFRGVLGHSLKKVVCALKRQECTQCLLRTSCVYAYFFDPESYFQSMVLKGGIKAPPHPYVIEVPEGTRRFYKQGDAFDFEIILFGDADTYLPHLIYAINEMGRSGIGKKTGPKRSSFQLERVTASGETVYSSRDGLIRKDVSARELHPDGGMAHEMAAPSVDLELITPLRLKYQNQLEATLPFHILVRAMLRRISSLCQCYGRGDPELDYKGLVSRAQKVEISQSTLQWFDWKRYSSRQEQAMFMGGIVGSVSYMGDLDEYMPLIRFCEQVHVGKQTTFGLGKIAVKKVGR